MAWQFTPGEILTATNLNAVTLPWNAVAIVQRTAVQSFTDATTAAMSFTATDLVDPLAWHNPAGGNPERVVPTIAGWYLIVGHSEFSSGITTCVRRVTRIAKNGTAIHQGQDQDLVGGGPSSLASQDAVAYTSLNGTTDYITMECLHDDSGGSARNLVGQMMVQLIYPT